MQVCLRELDAIPIKIVHNYMTTVWVCEQFENFIENCAQYNANGVYVYVEIIGNSLASTYLIYMLNLSELKYTDNRTRINFCSLYVHAKSK